VAVSTRASDFRRAVNATKYHGVQGNVQFGTRSKKTIG
jgi:hypothetical protein